MRVSAVSIIKKHKSSPSEHGYIRIKTQGAFMERELAFTLYRNAQDTAGRPVTQSWQRWLERFLKHEFRGSPEDSGDKSALDRAKNGQAIVLGELPEGKPRRGIHVRAIHALALDIENLPEEKVEKAFKALQPFAFVVWTTHKHGSEIANGHARLRVLLPLAEPLEPSNHASAWSGLNQLVEGVNDPATRDIGRLHFLPSTFNPKVAWSVEHPGRWLRLEDLPDVEVAGGPDFDAFSQHQALASIKSSLKWMRREAKDLKEASKALLEGRPFANAGTRHDTILVLTMWIAVRDRTLSSFSIGVLFGPSIQTMLEADPSAPTIEEVQVAYAGAVEKLEGFDKGRDKYRDEKTRRLQIEKAAAGQGPYTNEDLECIAARNEWTIEELKDKWVIQRDGCAWFLTETGEFAGPYSRDDLSLAASKYLARAPVRLIEITKAGFKYRPVSEMVRESGSLADAVISDMTIQRTSFDSTTRILHEAIIPIRKELGPEFDPEIDGWLKVVGGPLYSKLVDWMACAPDLTKLLCAIYFDGAPSSGKTLFAHGMAKIWTEGPPADIESVLSDFNDELSRCPFVIADEEIPKRWRSTVTTTLRSMLSTMSRTLKRKYKPTSEVRGAIRLVLAANNEFLLDSREVSSSQDLEAIAQRFLYIPVPHEAAALLNQLPREKKERWMKEGIAQHALWLLKNHQVQEPGKRFWVEGDVSQMHRLLMTGSRWNSLACEWLVRYLMNPHPFDTKDSGLILRTNGKLLVNDQAILDGWELYLKTKQEAETSKVGSALRAISKTTRRQQRRFGGRQIRYRDIDVDHLISWSDRYNIGDRASLLEAVGEPGSEPEETKNEQ